MAILSRATLLLGSLLLIHAAYSAHEHTTLLALSSSSGASTGSPSTLTTISTNSKLASLPLDITIETIVSVVLLCVAIVSGSDDLKPISWRTWAGEIEKKKLEGKSDQEDGEGYWWLEQGKRKGFVDIRAQRKDFAEWAKGQKS